MNMVIQEYTYNTAERLDFNILLFKKIIRRVSWRYYA